MKEVYYVMGHGVVQTTNVLTHRERLGIPIVTIGTEGELTYPCPTILLIHYYMKIHGNLFMNKLLTILLEYGEKYHSQFQPDDTKLEKDIRFLFDVNREDVKRFPQNKLRAYSGSTKLLNTSLRIFRPPHETFFYDAKLLHNTKKFLVTFEAMTSSLNSQYSFNELTFSNQDQFFSLVNPFGIFKFNEQARIFDMKYRLTEAIHPVSDVLKEIRRQSLGVPIVFMIHCKEPDKTIMPHYDFKKNPVQKLQTRSLVEMMKVLTVKGTPTKTPIDIRPLTITKKPTKSVTRKRKTTNQTTVTIRKPSATRPTKRTKLTQTTPPTRKRKTTEETSVTIRKTSTTRPTKRTKLD